MKRLLYRLERTCWMAGGRIFRLGGKLCALRRRWYPDPPEPVVVPYTYADQRLFAWLDGGQTPEDVRRMAN
jgi:hypothetical protein